MALTKQTVIEARGRAKARIRVLTGGKLIDEAYGEWIDAQDEVEGLRQSLAEAETALKEAPENKTGAAKARLDKALSRVSEAEVAANIAEDNLRDAEEYEPTEADWKEIERLEDEVRRFDLALSGRGVAILADAPQDD